MQGARAVRIARSLAGLVGPMQESVDGIICFAERDQAFGEVVQRKPRRLEAIRQDGEDRSHIVLLRQAMVARHPVIRLSQRLKVFEIRKAAGFRPKTDAFGKNTRHEKGMIANVSADQEARAVVGLLERSQHFKKIIERRRLPRQDAPSVLNPGEFGENLRHIIGYRAIFNSSAPEDLADQDVKVEMGGDLKTTAM